MKKLNTILLAIIFSCLITVNVKADINYNLLYEWSKQPTNVQYSLARQGVTIEVAPFLNWNSSDLMETWAYTQVFTKPDLRTITACKIILLQNHEDCLTHEVGHALSNYNGYRYFWTDNYIWDSIYVSENSKQMIYPQGWQNKYEYFACCYEEYLKYPLYMKKLQPSSYNYISVVLSYQ